MGSTVVMRSSNSAMRRILYSVGLLVMWWGAALMMTHLSTPEMPQAEPIKAVDMDQPDEALCQAPSATALTITQRAEAVAEALEVVLPEAIASTIRTHDKRDRTAHGTGVVGPACYRETEADSGGMLAEE